MPDYRQQLNDPSICEKCGEYTACITNKATRCAELDHKDLVNIKYDYSMLRQRYEELENRFHRMERAIHDGYYEKKIIDERRHFERRTMASSSIGPEHMIEPPNMFGRSMRF